MKNPRAEAIKEISKEKARIFRKKTEDLPLLEKIALEWKKKKEAEERQRQKETLSAEGGKKGASEELSFRQILAKEVVDYDKQRLLASPAGDSGEIGWAQYKPWQKEEPKKKKQIPLNTATVVAIRKKLVAMEWARALGKRTQGTRFRDLEQEAAIWKEKRKEEKRRKEEIRMRIEKHREVLSEALAEFGKRLREKRETTDPKELSALLEKSLENAGEVFDIEWGKDGCLIWIEPWEEKKLRRISGFDIPVIYRVKINENFEISSYEEVEDEEIIESLKNEILTKPLKRSLEGISFNIDNEDEAQQFLEDKLSDIGRLINLERTEIGWLATIESWEEMRLRNIKRKGKPPIITDKIEINWKDGKLEFATEGSAEEQSDECTPEEEGDDIIEEGGDIDETQMTADRNADDRRFISNNQRPRQRREKISGNQRNKKGGLK